MVSTQTKLLIKINQWNLIVIKNIIFNKIIMALKNNFFLYTNLKNSSFKLNEENLKKKISIYKFVFLNNLNKNKLKKINFRKKENTILFFFENKKEDTSVKKITFLSQILEIIKTIGIKKKIFFISLNRDQILKKNINEKSILENEIFSEMIEAYNNMFKLNIIFKQNVNFKNLIDIIKIIKKYKIINE